MPQSTSPATARRDKGHGPLLANVIAELQIDGRLTMKSWMCSTLILIGFLSPHAQCAVSTAAQINMSKHIDTAIEWTNHLRDEVRKRTNAKEIESDLAGITSFLSAINTTAEQIILESPSEKAKATL
jgi:hypothetical protein